MDNGSCLGRTLVIQGANKRAEGNIVRLKARPLHSIYRQSFLLRQEQPLHSYSAIQALTISLVAVAGNPFRHVI